jgi:hypothetical protein
MPRRLELVADVSGLTRPCHVRLAALVGLPGAPALVAALDEARGGEQAQAAQGRVQVDAGHDGDAGGAAATSDLELFQAVKALERASIPCFATIGGKPQACREPLSDA